MMGGLSGGAFGAFMIKKLRGSSGASIVVALLMLLLCVTVGMTALAAAASDAGKAVERENEQQAYFAAKSALELVCGRLEKMEYRPNMSFTEIVVSNTIRKEDSYGNLICSIPYTYKKTTFTQELGAVTFGGDAGAGSNWNEVLPFRKEFDCLFADRVSEKVCTGYHGSGKFQDDDVHTHSVLGGTDVSAPVEHLLKISLSGDGVPEALKEEAKVRCRIGKPGSLGAQKYWIFVEAEVPGSGMRLCADLEPYYVFNGEPEGEAAKVMDGIADVFPNINYRWTYNGPYPGLEDKADRAVLKWRVVQVYTK